MMDIDPRTEFESDGHVLDLERDLVIAEAIAGELKPYLLSNTLYWPLQSSRHVRYALPNGTLGSLLMRLHQLAAIREQLTSGQMGRLDNALATTQAELDHWVVQAEEKTRREVKARARAWSLYVAEAEARPERYEDEYPMQARGRSALHFLQEFSPRALNGSSLVTEVIVTDNRLRGYAKPGPFVLPAALLPAYPEELFWWLHVRLTGEEKENDD